MTALPDLPPSHAFDNDADAPRHAIIRVAKLGGAGTLSVFLIGGAAGALAAMTEDGRIDAKGIAVVAAFALAGIAAAVWFARLLRRASAAAPETPRATRARRMLVIAGAIGVVLGLLFAMGGMGEPGFAVSEAPIPPIIALATLAIIGIAVPAVTFAWHRSVDEHEEQVYRFSALIAIYTYSWISPMWWIAARGGFVPTPDATVIFGIVMAVWGLAWAWGKYR